MGEAGKGVMMKRWHGGLRLSGPLLCSFIHSFFKYLLRIEALLVFAQKPVCMTDWWRIPSLYHYSRMRRLRGFTLGALREGEALQAQPQGVSTSSRMVTGIGWLALSYSPFACWMLFSQSSFWGMAVQYDPLGCPSPLTACGSSFIPQSYWAASLLMASV